jgi:hypothetical protein
MGERTAAKVNERISARPFSLLGAETAENATDTGEHVTDTGETRADEVAEEANRAVEDAPERRADIAADTAARDRFQNLIVNRGQHVRFHFHAPSQNCAKTVCHSRAAPLQGCFG